MAHEALARLSRDTTRSAEDMQLAIWRSLSSMEIAEIVSGASRATRELAIAGLRQRHPDFSEGRLVAAYAALTLGAELARRAYPELEIDSGHGS